MPGRVSPRSGGSAQRLRELSEYLGHGDQVVGIAVNFGTIGDLLGKPTQRQRDLVGFAPSHVDPITAQMRGDLIVLNGECVRTVGGVEPTVQDGPGGLDHDADTVAGVHDRPGSPLPSLPSKAKTQRTAPPLAPTVATMPPYPHQTPTAPATAVFSHVDDAEIPWQQARRQRNADGTTSSVWEKWLAFGTDPMYLSLYARWDPGMIVRRHGHNSPHVVQVLRGELWCEDRRLSSGSHIELPEGAAFGPFRAGDDGCELFEVMMGDPRSWGDRPKTYAALCTEHGVTPLPDPPVDLPPGMVDLRTLWAD